MKKTIFLLSGLLILFAACAKPPTEEINKAVEALNRAENDPLVVSMAGNTLSRARDALQKMQDEVDAKRYESAKIFAADVVTLAERAITEGQSATGRTREEAAMIVANVRTMIAETESAFNRARTNSNLQLDLDSIIRGLDTAKSEFDRATQSLQTNNYQDAINRSQTVRTALLAVTAGLNDAAQIILSIK